MFGNKNQPGLGGCTMAYILYWRHWGVSVRSDNVPKVVVGTTDSLVADSEHWMNPIDAALGWYSPVK